MIQLVENRKGCLPELYSKLPSRTISNIQMQKKHETSDLEITLRSLYNQQDIDNLLANIEADRTSIQKCFEIQMTYADKLRAAILEATPRINALLRYNMVIAVNLHPEYFLHQYFGRHSRATFVFPVSYVMNPEAIIPSFGLSSHRLDNRTFNGVFRGSENMIDDGRVYVVIQKPDKTHQFITDLATRLGADIWFYGYPLSKVIESPVNKWPSPRNTVSPSRLQIDSNWVSAKIRTTPKDKIIEMISE